MVSFDETIFPYQSDDIDFMYYKLATFLKESNMDKYYFNQPTRHGMTREMDQPTSFVISQFNKYFVTNPGRVINLPFALAELIWIMSGSNADWIINYNKKMADYVDEIIDDKRVFNAAYGYRMRNQFSIDQLFDIIAGFTKDMDSRQNVIMLRDPIRDRSSASTLDRACNIALMFLIRNDKVNMTRVCRSNDFMWGIPYNCIQFGHIQQTVAEALQLDVGEHVGFANSLHLYENHFNDIEKIGYRNWTDEFDFTVPDLGDAIKVYMDRPETLRTVWLETIEEYGKKDDFGFKDIKIMAKGSPFWIDGLMVLLSYQLKGDVDRCLATLELVKSDLFRLMALRYYYRYYKRFREGIESTCGDYKLDMEFIRS